MSCDLLQGDALEVLKVLPAESVQCCITSPPYFGLRDYGIAGQIGLERTVAEYVKALVDVFIEVRRILKPDGTIWLNVGDTYANYKDSKNPGQTLAKGTSRESAHVITGLNYTRNGPALKEQGIKDKELIGVPWRLAFALSDAGLWLRQEIIWNKPNPTPERVKDRCTRSHESVFLLTKSKNYFYDNAAIAAKAADGSDEMVNKKSVWTVNTARLKAAHFATYPPELIEPMIFAGSRKNDTVLDPFNGAGTTGLVALKNRRSYVGIDLNPDYLEITRERFLDAQIDLF